MIAVTLLYITCSYISFDSSNLRAQRIEQIIGINHINWQNQSNIAHIQAKQNNKNTADPNNDFEQP